MLQEFGELREMTYLTNLDLELCGFLCMEEVHRFSMAEYLESGVFTNGGFIYMDRCAWEDFDPRIFVVKGKFVMNLCYMFQQDWELFFASFFPGRNDMPGMVVECLRQVLTTNIICSTS